ncbi:MAG: ribosomal-processing cysteine protease Prp [Oscillospiraceae bacterium]|nr:ribosomal-processing cysteine protease Prp [Oscillospiraceae bacterium]
MITATFTADKESGSIILRVTGHAGYAPKGSDTICSAASVLAYTLSQVMKRMYEESSLHDEPQIYLEEGDTTILARPVKERYNECLHAFFVIQVGFELLSRSYPDYVELVPFGDQLD